MIPLSELKSKPMFFGHIYGNGRDYEGRRITLSEAVENDPWALKAFDVQLTLLQFSRSENEDDLHADGQKSALVIEAVWRYWGRKNRTDPRPS